LAALSVT
jgi:hypothetical protein